MSMAGMLFAGVNGATVLALTPVFVVVELLKEGRQIFDNTFQFYFRTINQLVAIRAIPFECVLITFGARYFNDDAYSIGRTLGGMAHVFGQKENFAFLDRNFQ